MQEILVSLGLMLGCGILILVFQFAVGTPDATANSILNTPTVAAGAPTVNWNTKIRIPHPSINPKLTKISFILNSIWTTFWL